MVTLSLNSKRFSCKIELKEKVTFVVGNSGQGKTEMVRRLSSNSSSKHVTVSDGFHYEVLTYKRFSDSCNAALRHILNENNMELNTFQHLKEDEKKGYYFKYWKDSLNFPFSNSILIIDDEDFVDSFEFEAFFNSDCSNYYLIINRLHLDKIGYSVSEVYNYKVDGTNHFLEKRYTLPTIVQKDFDYIVTEGIGSDYIFFKSMFGEKVINPTFNGKLKSGGRTNVARMIEANKEVFKQKKILILIDYVAFGANYASLLKICNEVSVQFCIKSHYQSFEYLLLCSNMIHDKELQEYVEKNRLRFHSLESLYTYRLKEITKDTLLSYKKEATKFSVCYYKKCCSNVNYQEFDCKLRLNYYKKNKFVELFRDTKFSDFLDLQENRKE
ncbi:MAG: hypothetical protein U0L23_02220 [Lachnospiraceae bacterium]|nr:hypothetical protein [Lachnospiraceae bacterium]MEE1341510.1 hypothetical protein [Lachnospiraceae bacterium]